MKKIAIITLNFNGKQNTIELLESLKNLKNENYELKIVVVDNASSDNSVFEIHKKFPQVDILQTGKNLGYGGGLNKGFEYGKIWGADYFLVINNDSKITEPNLLQKLINILKKDDKIAAVAPKIYFEKGFEFHKDRYSSSDLGKVIWYAGGKFDWNNIASIHRGIDEVDSGQYDADEEVDFLTGACFLIKNEALEKVLGFDGKYFLYFEDADLCKRLKDLGFKLFYTGQTFVYHKVSQSTGIGSNLTDYYHTRNRLIFGMQYAKDRTKFALLREALKWMIVGRKAQKIGVLDYFKGITGPNISFSPASKNFEYSLKLSIGIVNYNTPDLTKKLLESIFEKNSGFDKDQMEVVVLDNGEVNPSFPQIKQFLPKIKYLKNDENEGFSKGYNKTIKYSLGQYYLMLNSDIEVLGNGLKEIVKWSDHFQGQAVLGGRLVYPDGSNQDSAFHLPTISGAFKEYFLLKKGSYFMFEPKSSQPSKVEGLVMACFLIPQKVLQKVGLLDEGTFIFFEDIEYCRRLKKFNVPTYFVPEARFIHHHGASTQKIGVDKSYQFLQKSAKHYHGLLYYFVLNWVLRIGQKIGRVNTPRAKWIQNS